MGQAPPGPARRRLTNSEFRQKTTKTHYFLTLFLIMYQNTRFFDDSAGAFRDKIHDSQKNIEKLRVFLLFFCITGFEKTVILGQVAKTQ